jgi:RNA polymerase sporulation-specific sigma factor
MMSTPPDCNHNCEHLLSAPEYRRRVERIALKYTRGCSISWQDAAQTAHMKVFQAVKGGHFHQGGVKEFYCWAATVARFEIIDLIRQHKQQNWQSLDQFIPGTDLPLIETIPDEFNLLDTVERADLVHRAIETIRVLDRRYPSRGYLHLWQGKIQGKTETQLAAELGVSQGEISKRLNKELVKRIAEELGLLEALDIKREQHRAHDQQDKQTRSQMQ